MEDHIETGKWGEAEAIRLLKRTGMEILDVNWKFLHLEIDIVARDRNEIVVVEVKTRQSSEHGEPETFVNRPKQRKLIRAANYYLEHHRLKEEVRFDVIGILKLPNQIVTNHIRGAFSPNEL